jgi:hypothetical protein
MKGLIFVFLLLAMSFTPSCKDNPTGTSSGTENIIGEWRLQMISGGFAGQTTYPPENEVYLLHITSYMYQESKNDTVTFSDYYRTYVDTATYHQQVIDFLNSKRTSVVVSSISIDSLSLWDGFIDGFSFLYTRTK